MDDADPNTGSSQAPRLLDGVRMAIRRLHYSPRTEETYVYWIRRFIFFSDKRHPSLMGATEVTAFLNHLAADRNVAAATQNQALDHDLYARPEQGRPRRSEPARPPALSYCFACCG